MADRRLKQNLTLAGIVFMALAIPLTIVAVNIAGDIFTKADLTEEPQEIFVTNQTSSSATITWTTQGNETAGFIKYGVNEENLTEAVFDERDTGAANPRKNHSVVLKNLNPGTTYYFTFIIGAVEYDNAGSPYSFKTYSVSDESPPTPYPVNGSVSPATEDVTIYAYAFDEDGKSTVVSTLTNSSGRYSFDAANFLDRTTGDPFSVDDADILVFASKPDSGVAKTQFIASKSPAILTLSISNAFSFNPDEDLALLPRDGETPTPTEAPEDPEGIAQNTTAQQMIESSVNIAGFDKNPQIPHGLKISNISDTSFTVSWLTKEPTTGYALYGTSTPNKSALDARDGSIAAAKKRFTHSVTIQESTFATGTKIKFQIVSNSKVYNNGIVPFEYIIPEVLSSPPGIQTVSGTIDPLFSTTDLRDYILTARLQSDGENSTWMSVVPSTSGTYNLNIASARNIKLTSSFSPKGADLKLSLNGERNSILALTASPDDDTADLSPETGLSMSNLTEGEIVASLATLAGTAEPGSDVKITVSGPQTFSGDVTAEADGDWSVSLANVTAPGEYQITLESRGEVLGLSAQLNLGNLPEAGIEDNFPYFIAIVPLLLGIYAIYITKMRKK